MAMVHGGWKKELHLQDEAVATVKVEEMVDAVAAAEAPINPLFWETIYPVLGFCD